MTFEEESNKARVEYDKKIDEIKKKYQSKMQKEADKAELKYTRRITQLKKDELARQSMEITRK